MRVSRVEAERLALAVLAELQKTLAEALNSLEGKVPVSPESGYAGWMAKRANEAICGYHYLRDSGRVAASRLLIRPIIEALFCTFASTRQPVMVLKIAYSELQQEKHLFATNQTQTAKADSQLQDIAARLKEAGAEPPKKRGQLTVKELARAAGLDRLYPWYRFYCQFTHNTLAAVVGDYDEVADHHDSLFVCQCGFLILQHLKMHTPAAVPDLIQLLKRYAALRGVPLPGQAAA